MNDTKKELLLQSDACHVVRDFIAHFSNPLRLRIMCELSKGEASVSELADAIGARQPNVSLQLNLLRLSGIVTRTRDGHRSMYKIADPLAVEMMEFIFSLGEKLLARREAMGMIAVGSC